MNSSSEFVFTGIGVVSSFGFGLTKQWQAITDPAPKRPADYWINSMEVRDYISDRRMLKAISALDGVGLAAIVGLKKEMQLAEHVYHPDRIGLYVGSTPSSLTSFEPYLDAMRDGQQGCVSERDFGLHSQRSRPMTLLVGLLNNVLCYGSMLLDARGPNSNYTSLLLGAHHALIHGGKRLQRGQADLVVVGGYTSRAHEADQSGFRARQLMRGVNTAGHLGIEPFAEQAENGLVFADAAAFVALERREAAERRGAHILASYQGGVLRSDAQGVMRFDRQGQSLEAAIHSAINQAQISVEDIGLIFASATGLQDLDTMEAEVITRIFAGKGSVPALACLSAVFGSGMEAGGILEIGLLSVFYDAGQVPGVLCPRRPITGTGSEIRPHQPYSLILRTSPWGEYSAVIVRRESL